MKFLLPVLAFGMGALAIDIERRWPNGTTTTTQGTTVLTTVCPVTSTYTQGTKTYTSIYTTTSTITSCKGGCTAPPPPPVTKTEGTTVYTTVCPVTSTYTQGQTTYTTVYTTTSTVTYCKGGCPGQTTTVPPPPPPTTITKGTTIYTTVCPVTTVYTSSQKTYTTSYITTSTVTYCPGGCKPTSVPPPPPPPPTSTPPPPPPPPPPTSTPPPPPPPTSTVGPTCNCPLVSPTVTVTVTKLQNYCPPASSSPPPPPPPPPASTTITKAPPPPPPTSTKAPPPPPPTSTSTPPPNYNKTCPANLNGPYQYPHLIVGVDSSKPTTALGNSFFATITSTESTIFNFDIPASYTGTCSLVFLFPLQKDLETSSFTFSGPGTFAFSQLSSIASAGTTYNTQGGVKTSYGTQTFTPGTAGVVSTFKCPTGQTVSYEISSVGGTSLSYFQDYNPSPIGLYVTTC